VGSCAVHGVSTVWRRFDAAVTEDTRTLMLISADGLVSSTLGDAQRTSLEMRARYTVPVQVRDRAAVVHFDDSRSAAFFRSRYRDLPAVDQPDMRAYAVCDDTGNTHFWSVGGRGYTWPHGQLNAFATAFLADAVAMHALLTAIPAAIALHAAALRHSGRAFAVTGHSTAGKSTTAVACVAAGCQLYSDERTVITPAGTLPFPRAVNLRRGGIEVLLADLPPSALRERLDAHRGNDWNDVHFDELFDQNVHPEPAPLQALFAIAGIEAKPRSRRISAVEMLPTAQFGAITAAVGIDRASTLLRALHEIACFELILGTPCATAEHVLDVVAAGAAA
jgi:hypothetical protein